MRSVPLASPVAWTELRWCFLQTRRFEGEIGSDCLRHRGSIR